MSDLSSMSGSGRVDEVVTQLEVTVLDTSALITDPRAMFAFPDTSVVIPLIVISELDGLKTRSDDVGRAAREALRTIEDLRIENDGDIRYPVALPDGGTFHVEANGVHLLALEEYGLDISQPDNRILGAAKGQSHRGPVTVVSNDAALRIKAAQLGLGAAEHQAGSRIGEYERAGWRYVDVSSATIDGLYKAHSLTLAELADQDIPDVKALSINEFAVFRCGSQSALGRRRAETIELATDSEAWGLRPRSKEQRFALDLLLDPEVRVVALDGVAGTGKTILAIAAGLEQVVEHTNRRYGKVSVFRPIVPVGRAELGYLPGDLDEKLDPWMRAVNDALVALSADRDEQNAQKLIDELRDRFQLTMESVTFLRGRSLVNTYVLVDEAQNLEPTTLKTILTRVGEGSKIVFTGDVTQIDQPYLSERTNALSVLIDRLAGQQIFGHARLTSGERSEVADLAAKLL
ncbi:MAG: PhoH family protein [Acidimicrobiales bacterium]